MHAVTFLVFLATIASLQSARISWFFVLTCVRVFAFDVSRE